MCQKNITSKQHSKFFCSDQYINSYLKEATTIVLPKHIIIKSGNQELYFGPKITNIVHSYLVRYGHRFQLEDRGDKYIAEKGNRDNIDSDDEDIEIDDVLQYDNQGFLPSNRTETNSESNQQEGQNNVNITNETNHEEVYMEDIGPEEDLESRRNNDNVEDFNLNQSIHGENINTDREEPEEFRSYSKEKQKYLNMFLQPQHFSNQDIRTFLHMDKEQFLNFANAIEPYLDKKKFKKLSFYSIAFLFRLKLSKNYSFDELSALFVISTPQVMYIFKRVLQITYQYLTAIPNLLQDSIEDLFSDIYENLDEFYQELFKPFKDPTGKFY